MFYSPGQQHAYPSHEDDDALWESPAPENSRPSSPSPAPTNKDKGSPVPSSSNKKASAPPKRIRISIACVSCRHKKIKCDGQVPCSHCIKSAGKCVYPAATKPINHQYVETLENRLKSVELHLQELLSQGGAAAATTANSDNPDLQQHAHSTTDSGILSTHSSRQSTHYVPLASKPPTNLSLPIPGRLTGKLSSLLDLTSGTTAKGSSPTDATNDTADGSMEILEILLGNLKVERDGTAKFLPGLMQQQEESYARARTYNKSGPPGLSPIMDIPVLDWESTELPKPYTLPTSLLSPKVIKAMIDLYFTSVHTFLPILHKPSFLTLCQEGEFRVPPFLLMAMCAVASCHANETEMEEIARMESFKSHHILFDYARSLMDTYLDVPRLSTLQGLLLLAYYQVKVKRIGQYFRVRSYLGLAIHMALDMGLARDFYRHMEELESPSIFESVLGGQQSSQGSALTSASTSTSTQQNHHQQQQQQQQRPCSSDMPKSKEDRVRGTVIQQERHLTWLGCYFLDGIISSLAGQEYCVAHGHLETRKLIRAANGTADTSQAATLIFWFVHLDLVKQRRRISEMYRVLTHSPHRSQDASIISSIAQSTEMRSIEHALDTWLSTLPVHLVYPGRKLSADGVFADSSLPSYYTLYLHRFYYSHELLLYRPLITLSSFQGEFSDPKSPLSKCARAAELLTEIGEAIFQNYRWPWPGCGLFGYHMVQAIEIHVLLMVNYGKTDSQELFYKTMGLLKGFVSLAKLPELEKAILSMEQMVAGYIMNPESVSTLRWNNNTNNSTDSDSKNNNTPASFLQRYHQFQQQQPAPQGHDHSMPLSGQSNLEQMPAASDYNSLGAMSMSPVTPAISHLMQQHLHMDPQQHQRPHLNSPLMNNNSHIYSPLSSDMAYTSLSGAAGTLSSAVGVDLLHSNHRGGQGYGLHDGSINTNGGLDTATTPAEAAAGDIRAHSSSISSFLYNMDPPTPMSLYHQSAQDILPYTNYLHASNMLTSGDPVDDLVDFDSMVSPPPNSAPGETRPPPSSSQQQQQQQQQQARDQQQQDSQRVTFLAPAKPPKRIHRQFTGSTNSSSKSQSQKPPVPKKPSRLMSTVGGNSSWFPPSVPYPNTMNPPPYNDIPTSPYNRYDPHDGSATDSTPLLVGQPSPAPRRPLKVLQAQTQLYGLGALQSPLNRDDDKKAAAAAVTANDGFDADQYTIDIICKYFPNRQVAALSFMQH
ncbi:hypothetical protein BGX23_004131 [Mortierella sp. AD031]|nr:hypothetical protein BGX23_004131 [Mortierella sp. AD031]